MNPTKDIQCCNTSCASPFNGTFWDEKYKANETGWDLNQISPPLKSFINTISDKSLRILIPGCGNAYEAEYLLQQRFTNITIIDISSTLIEKLNVKFDGQPIQVLHGDFFEHKEKYDMILEQTFFCALDPSLRANYIKHCHNLLNNSGKIVGLLFDVISDKQGPPFGGTKNEYQKLFEPLFLFKQFNKCSNSVQARNGNELFIEMKKKILTKNQ